MISRMSKAVRKNAPAVSRFTQTAPMTCRDVTSLSSADFHGGNLVEFVGDNLTAKGFSGNVVDKTMNQLQEAGVENLEVLFALQKSDWGAIGVKVGASCFMIHEWTLDRERERERDMRNYDDDPLTLTLMPISYFSFHLLLAALASPCPFYPFLFFPSTAGHVPCSSDCYSRGKDPIATESP